MDNATIQSLLGCIIVGLLTLIWWAVQRYVAQNDRRHDDTAKILVAFTEELGDHSEKIKVIETKVDTHEKRLDQHQERLDRA